MGVANFYDKESWQIILATFSVVFAASLAVGSGVGGGSFFIAIFILLLGLDAHQAIPLSKATIFGVGLAAFSVNYFRRHPHTKSRPLIDYNLTAMFEPLTLCGTLVGVILNIILPAWLVIVPLCLLLAFTTYKTYKKGITIHKTETASAQTSASSEALNSVLLESMDSDADKESEVPEREAEVAQSDHV